MKAASAATALSVITGAVLLPGSMAAAIGAAASGGDSASVAGAALSSELLLEQPPSMSWLSPPTLPELPTLLPSSPPPPPPPQLPWAVPAVLMALAALTGVEAAMVATASPAVSVAVTGLAATVVGCGDDVLFKKHVIVVLLSHAGTVFLEFQQGGVHERPQNKGHFSGPVYTP